MPLNFKQRNGLLFIGGYKHIPNVDAAEWLIKNIMPIVWNQLGDIPVYLLGSYPPEEVSRLADKNVVVPGFLEDVSTYFLNARAFVAPLRFGAGMKGKIGQSLEFGLPVVSTSIGVEGMNLVHKKNVLVGDNAQDLSAEIIKIYSDEKIWQAIQDQAEASIKAYSPEVVEGNLIQLFRDLDRKL